MGSCGRRKRRKRRKRSGKEENHKEQEQQEEENTEIDGKQNLEKKKIVITLSYEYLIENIEIKIHTQEKTGKHKELRRNGVAVMREREKKKEREKERERRPTPIKVKPSATPQPTIITIGLDHPYKGEVWQSSSTRVTRLPTVQMNKSDQQGLNYP